MSRIIISLSLFAILVQGEYHAGSGPLAGYCNHSDECAADECCVSFIQPRGKRTIVHPELPLELYKLVKGMCHKVAAFNESCYVPGGLQPSTPGLYYDCPCGNNLYCKGTGRNTFLFDKGEPGYCMPQPAKRSSLGQPCASGVDCEAGQCCVSINRPRGRRQLGHDMGTCKAMATLGSSCLTRYQSGKPIEMVFQCPCDASLTCHGTGMMDVPLGEIGKCGV